VDLDALAKNGEVFPKSQIMGKTWLSSSEDKQDYGIAK